MIVLIPAHNEEDEIGATLEALAAQTWPPDRVLVVADNCTDRTVSRARSKGVDVLETVENTARKAGALNQAWNVISPSLDDDDFLVVQDADSQLCPTWIESAMHHHASRTHLGAIGGCFYGRPQRGSIVTRYLSLLQQMEFVRWHRSIARRKGATRVLTGTGTMFRVGTLRRVAGRGFVYDESSIVEDYEITLALRHRGLRTLSPKECVIHTDVMPTLGKLWRQRLRWQRGALDELRKYGLCRVTADDFRRQALMYLGVPVRVVFAALIVASFALHGGLAPSAEWTAVGGIIAVERAVTVRRLGGKAALCAFLVLPELLYDIFTEAVWVAGAAAHVRGRPHSWGQT